MSNVYTEGWESGFGTWTQSGTGISNDTLVSHAGARSVLIDKASAGIAYIVNSWSGTVGVVQFWFRIATAPGGSQAICSFSNAQGNLQVVLSSARVIRAQVGTTFTSGVTLALNQWYRIDAKMDSSTGTASTVLRIDGANEITASRAQTQASISDLRVGANTSTTYKYNYDDLLADNSAAAYPLSSGNSTTVFPGNAAGAGASLQMASSLKPRAGQATATGQTWSGITGVLFVGAIGAPGIGDLGNGQPDILIRPDADPGVGTGTVPVGRASLRTPVGHAAATGAAHNATRANAAASSEIASGLGVAADATTTKTLSVTASLGSGTGTGANASIVTVVSSSDPGLTLQMGM